jgi:uncharacterized membrane protein
MPETVTWLQMHLREHQTLYFICLYAVGGRPAAVASARFMGMGLGYFLPFILFMDLIQVPCFYLLYQKLFRHPRFVRARERFSKKLNKLRSSRLLERAQAWGPLGVVVVTLMPVKGGGMWSGTLLAYSLGLRKQYGLLLLILGSILGTLLLAGLLDSLLLVIQRLI